MIDSIHLKLRLQKVKNATILYLCLEIQRRPIRLPRERYGVSAQKVMKNPRDHKSTLCRRGCARKVQARHLQMLYRNIAL